MRLADFIETNIDPILAEWVTFARTRPGAGAMDLSALRDHAAEMLAIIVADLRTTQTDDEQHTKSYGEDDSDPQAAETAAETHGAGRATSGFTVSEMVAEFRALRASVLRLWTDSRGALEGEDVLDLVRFNEAVDQALAESMTRFTRSLDQSQDMFVAILGHDLRTPLQTVTMVTQHLLDSPETGGAQRDLLARSVRSAGRMGGMIDDLLDFTRSRLGSGVTVERVDTDLARVARDAVEELEVAHPGLTFTLHADGGLTGQWDAGRIRQVLANLLGNAVQHGDKSRPVTVRTHADAADVTIEVHNFGPAIPPAAMTGLFSPFKRLRKGGDSASQPHNLGLGLYIADRIVAAHGGRIEVTSTEADGTRFVVRLPRAQRA